jgi:hypothetical protein
MVVISLVRGRRPWRYVAAALVAVGVGVAGCNSGAAPHAAPRVPHAKVSLKLQMRGGSGSRRVPESVTCNPAGRSQRAGTAACSVLLKLKQKNPFAPIPGGMNCPMLLRSNRKILVTGTWFGVKVHRLVVDGGCDIALFDSLIKILR